MGGKPKKKPEPILQQVDSDDMFDTETWTDGDDTYFLQIQPAVTLTPRALKEARLTNMRYRFGWVLGTLLHQVVWVLHNTVIHPLVGVLPFKPVFWLHDKSQRLMGRLV
jgi:hypothetical protein